RFRQIEEVIVRLAGQRLLERRGLLAVGVAAAAIGADLAGAELVPGLGHVQHHAVVVDGLEGEGDVGGDLRQEAGVGVAVGVDRFLPVLAELAYGDLAEDAQALGDVVVVRGVAVAAALAGGVGVGFEGDDANRVDVVVGVASGVGA